MPEIGPRVHELPLKERSGTYRIIYAVVTSGKIGVLRAFKKTTQAAPKADLKLAQKRMKEL